MQGAAQHSTGKPATEAMGTVDMTGQSAPASDVHTSAHLG